MIGWAMLRGARARRPGSSRMTSSGSLPSGRRTTSTSVSRPLVLAALDLAHERGQLRGPERGRVLARRVHVIRERDARRVAREQLHLARRERGAQAARRRSRSPAGAPSARPCCPPRAPPGRCFRMAVLALSMRYSVRLLSNSDGGRGVEVLGALVAAGVPVRPQDAARRSRSRAPLCVPDGEHDACPEAVVDAPAALAAR